MAWEHRCNFEIWVDVLKTLRDHPGLALTHLYAKANINHIQASRVIRLLESKGLIENYSVTAKGLEAIRRFESILALVSAISTPRFV